MRFIPKRSEGYIPPRKSRKIIRLYGFLNRKIRGIRDKEKGESLPQSLFHFVQPIRALENFTGLRSVRSADDSILLHQINQMSSAPIADTQTALQQGSRSFAELHDQAD